MINTKIEKVINLTSLNPDKELYLLHSKKVEQEHYNSPASIAIVSDLEIVNQFEEETGKQIGVLDNQPYYNVNLDLYQDKNNGRLFRYVNVEYPNNGKSGAAMFVVLKSNNKDLILLERHYRPFINKYQYEIPRGFSDLNEVDTKITAIRELKEETGVTFDNRKIVSLGTMFTDSGLCNAEVSLYAVELKMKDHFILNNNDDCENIHGYILLDMNDVCEMVATNQLTDSFTLTAILKYREHKNFINKDNLSV